MSLKSAILLGLLVFAGYSLTRHQPPPPPGATAAESMAAADAGIGARFKFGVGLLGSRLVRSAVTGMVKETQQSLTDMQPAIKATRGGNSVRAQQFAKKIVDMDEAALIDLEYGRPIKAVRGAMEAKSLLNAVRTQTGHRI